MRTVKHLFLFFILSSLCLALPTLAASLTATPDRTVIGEDETLQLSVRLDQQVGFGGPDFSLLEEHFEILNQHRSNQFRSINGRTEGWTEWNMILAPKKSGKLLIPSFNFEGSISDAVEITVNSSDGKPEGLVKDIFVEMETDKDQIYVQEQLLVTYRIFSAIQVREISLAESLVVDNANVEVASESSYTKQIQGRTYRASEITYAIHPQKSEPITIPVLTWNLVTAGSRATWFNDPFRSSQGQVRRLRTESRTVPVNAKPDSYTGRDWIPASSVELEQHWSSNPDRFVVGEPITRTLSLTAKGLRSSQLPAIPQAEGTGIKMYTDQPQFDETKSSQGITGVRIETSAIVPTQAGKLRLEPVEVTWWDTINNRQQTATLPAQVVNVGPAAISDVNRLADQNQTPSPEDNIQTTNRLTDEEGAGFSTSPSWLNPSLLLASNIVFAGLSLLFFIAWLRAKQKPVHTENDADDKHQLSLNKNLQNIRRACGDNQPLACKQALGLWAQEYWGLNHIASLQDISRCSGDKKLSQELEGLDHLLYGGGQDQTKWQGKAFWNALNQYRKQANTKQGKKTQTQLKPLYPSPA